MAKNKKVNLNNKQKRLVTIATIVAIVAIIICVVLTIVQYNKYKDVAGNEPINEKFEFLVDDECEEITNNDLQKKQYNTYQKLMDEFDKGDYTLENPYVVRDPFEVSPQTALIMFETKKKVSVKATIKGKNNDDLTVNFEASKKHVLPIYGLYGGYDNKVVLETSNGDKKTVSIKIDVVGNTPKVDVVTNKIKNSNGEFYFGTSALGIPTSAYDNYGELRWYLTIGYTKGMTMLTNGHMLLSNVAAGKDVTSTSGVIEIDMLGYIYNEFELEGGYHHDGMELKNGNYLLLTSDPKTDNIADHIVELNPKTGKIVKQWSLRKAALNIDPNLIKEYEITWGWINGIDFDYDTDTLILSVRNNNSVVGMDYKTGEIKWILGEEKYWSSKFRNLLIKGTGNDFIYPAGCHAVHVLEGGKISIFNNGYNAFREDTVSCQSLRNNESYGIIYNIDYDKKTASIDWKFGGQKYFSYALSSLTYTPDNHKIFNSGWHFTEAAYANPNCDQFGNAEYDAFYIEFDKNNDILVELHLNESKFEVVKAPIYNLEYASIKSKKVKTVSNYEVKLGNFKTTGEFEKFDILSEDEALEYQDSFPYILGADYFNNRLSVAILLDDVQTMQIVFISPRGTAYRYFMKKDENDKGSHSLIVTNLPSGRYYIYANIDGIKYNAKQFINVE